MSGRAGDATAPIRVFLCDDVERLRTLVRLELEEDPQVTVVGEAGDGLTAVAAIGRSRPDVVLLDLSMPGFDGLEAIPRVRALCPHTAIVVLSGFAAGRISELALEAGAARYIEKGEPIEVVREAVRRLGRAARVATG